jgi:hypothetical protein
MTRHSKRKYRSKKMQSISNVSSGNIGAVLKHLAVRAGRRILRFLWRQVKWGLWIGSFLIGSYLAMYLHYMWVGVGLLWIAIFIAVGWLMQLIKYEEHDYSSRSGRSRESPLEIQQKEVQEDIDAYQREQEDRHA